MKRIVEFIRGGSLFPFEGKRDIFDSQAFIINTDTNCTEYSTEQANTDFANGYKGGILKEGVYAYICGFRKDNGKKVLYIFDKQYIERVYSSNDLTLEMRTLPSVVKNPNHNGKFIITCVLVHGDGLEGGWSQGCLTIYPNEWEKFINHFNENDKGILHLKTANDWKIK